jgi:hypothetical protein
MHGDDPWGNPGDMGIPVLWDFSSTTGKMRGSAGDLRKQAESQIDAAKAGQRLASMRSEIHPSWTYTGASNDVGAYYRVGYWLGVAGRLMLASGQNPLAAVNAAQQAVRKGYMISMVPFLADEDPRKIQRILYSGSQMAARAGIPDVAKVLGLTSTTQSIASAQRRTQDTQLGPSLAKQAPLAAQDVADVAEQATGLVTGKKPANMGEWEWFWRKWGLRLVIGWGIVIVAAIVLRPYIGSAKGAARSARDSYDGTVAAWGSRRGNPKRKKGKKGNEGVPLWLVGGAVVMLALVLAPSLRRGVSLASLLRRSE